MKVSLIFTEINNYWDYEKYPTFIDAKDKDEQLQKEVKEDWDFDMNNYYLNLFGEDWKQVLEIRNFLKTKKLA